MRVFAPTQISTLEIAHSQMTLLKLKAISKGVNKDLIVLHNIYQNCRRKLRGIAFLTCLSRQKCLVQNMTRISILKHITIDLTS